MKRFLVACFLVLLTAGIVFGEDAKQKPQTLIGNEIVAVAQAVVTISEDFTKSNLGSLAYYALVWKFIIKPVFINIILCLPLWIFLNIYLWRKCDHFFGTERIENKREDGTLDVRYVRKYDFRGEGATGAGLALTVLACLINLCGFIVVFG